MIIDVTGTVLIPGNHGMDCPGNGLTDWRKCCCDECDYQLCCYGGAKYQDCLHCTDLSCPRASHPPDKRAKYTPPGS